MSETKLKFVAVDYAYEEYIKSLKERDASKTPKIIYGAICCPNDRCGKMFDTFRGPYGNGPAFYNFCPNCGQRLNWNGRKKKDE